MPARTRSAGWAVRRGGGGARAFHDRIFAGCLAVVACACTPGARYPSEADRLDPEAIRMRVSRVRGLADRNPAPVRIVDAERFERLLDARTGPERRPRRQQRGLGGAVQLVAEQARAVQLADTVGFYDRSANRIFLRRRSRAQQAGLPLSWVLAHELLHALQGQHFRVLETDALASVDEQLAYLALLEGDAMVTMLAYGAGENFVPAERAVLNAIRGIRRGEVSRMERMASEPDTLESAPPLVRERMTFPYLSGAVFVGHLYRAGGFALVNHVYDRPPRTTEQVIHPEKYLAGEGAIPIGAPVPPPGYGRSAAGRVGELGVRGLLQHCVAKDVAYSAAAGWGGDAFTAARHPSGAEIVLWSTAWDTEADAGEFARAIAACYRDANESYVSQRGHRVSVIAGAPVRNAQAIHDYLLRLPRAAPALEPPLGAVRLRPIPELPAVPAPYLAEGRYIHPRLGIAMPLPRGFKVTLEDGWLSAERDGSPPALLSVGFSPSIVTTESLGKLYGDFIDVVRPNLGGLRLEVASNDRVTTPLGPALERTWAVARTSIRIQVVVVPVCSGNGSIVYSRFWSDDHSGRVLEWVLDSTRAIDPFTPPVCAELTP